MTSHAIPATINLPQLKPLERRANQRFPCNLETSYRLVAAVGDEFWTTRVRNISPGGISLIVSQPLEPGTILAVELMDRTTQRFSGTLEVRVVYTVEHPSGDWIMGGAFTSRLSDDELQALVK
jgi:hypothetical protein